jgi:hypothetical protein
VLEAEEETLEIRCDLAELFCAGVVDRAVQAAVRFECGIVLGSRSFDWLCEQGHIGLERVAKARRDPALVGPVTAALEPLGALYARLQGDISVLRASRENLLLPVDLVHEPTGTVIEVDDTPHFTSFRLAALELYPADVSVGFDLDEHKDLCRAWCSRTDGLARGVDGDGTAAYRRHRASLFRLHGS